MTANASADDVLEYWFGALDELGRADDAHTQRWWSKDPNVDRDIRDRFAKTHAAALRSELARWLDTPRGTVAYIVVLDQFSRNMFRDTAAMFAGDPLALSAALSGIERGIDRGLPLDQRSTFYMPLMHSEEIALQERCVALYQAFAAETSGHTRASLLSRIGYAERHRDVVRKFGRFPHRNAILGRASSPEELDFLEGPGSSF
jgi:uncharacterized protein (DUF924 family)